MPQKFMIIRKNEYYRSRKFIFAINTQNDFLDDSRFCFNGDWVVIYCRLVVINYGSLLLLNWYFYSSGPKPLSSLPLGKFSQDLQWGS